MTTIFALFLLFLYSMCIYIICKMLYVNTRSTTIETKNTHKEEYVKENKGSKTYVININR